MRVAVIGAAGSAGQRHCAAFQAEGCEVVPVEIGQYWPSQPTPIYSIAAPDDDHSAMVRQAMSFGSHVFCEKPLAHNRFSLDLIDSRAKAGSTTFSCNLPLRYSHKLRNLDLGDITYMAGSYGWGRKSKMAGWRGQIPGYSIVCGGGIHLVDLMMHKAGAMTITDVKALKRGQIVAASFNAGAALCNLTVDFSYEGRHEVNMTFGNAGGHLPIWFDEPNDFREPIRDFLADVKAGRPGNGREALAANRACLAIEEAAA